MAFYTNVDSTKKFRLGTKKRSITGNEYIYLTGVGSTVANDVVTYDEAFASTRIAANAVGPVAVAQAAVDATTKYGWYLIWGTGSANTDTVAADKACFIDGTAGRVDDAVVTGDLIVGMFTRSADTSNVATVELRYPVATDVLG